MIPITLELDDKLVDRLKAEAAQTGDALEVYLRRRIESLPTADPFRGAIKDPMLIDQLLDDIMSARETQTPRTLPLS